MAQQTLVPAWRLDWSGILPELYRRWPQAKKIYITGLRREDRASWVFRLNISENGPHQTVAEMEITDEFSRRTVAPVFVRPQDVRWYLPPKPPLVLVMPVVGWRVWMVCRGQLMSLIGNNRYGPYFLRPRQPATCVGKLPCDSAPTYGCRCGYWMFDTLENFRASDVGLHVGYAAFGRVLAWGRIIKHERGYRAQYIWPEKVWLSESAWTEKPALQVTWPRTEFVRFAEDPSLKNGSTITLRGAVPLLSTPNT